WSYDVLVVVCYCYNAWLLACTATTLRGQNCGWSVDKKPHIRKVINGGCAGREYMSCVPAKPLELRRWYLIMLLLQSMAPSGYSRSSQAPHLWMQHFSTRLSSDLLGLRCSRCSMLLLQCLAAGLYNTKPLTSKLRN